jgi:diaminopropionate ammonia-lyase
MGVSIWQKSPGRSRRERWILDPRESATARETIASWDFYRPSPVREMSNLARHLGVKHVVAVDESQRMPLKSFKLLGAVYALARVVAERASGGATPASVFRMPREVIVGDIRVVAATDGNHGTALAWAAHRLGIPCTIFLPRNASLGRENRIRGFGADTVRVAGTYDEAVRIAHHDAVRNGWIVIQDTTLAGFERHCLDIMHGYTLLVHEALTQLGDARPSHVFVQAGVGGLAAATASYLIDRYGPDRPKFIVAEAERAACVMASLRHDRPVAVPGPHDTMMAGIACGEASEVALKVLSHATDAAVCIDDDVARDALKLCARLEPDVEIGETGIAGLAALHAVCGNDRLRMALEIDERSTVLTLITEGITDPEAYRTFLQGVSTGHGSSAMYDQHR